MSKITFSRRFVLGLLPLVLAMPALAEEHPSVAFMNKMGEELLHAHRLGTKSALLRVVQRYADLEAIGDESIGNNQIPDGQESHYRRGVANFIARYIAEQSRSYPVAKFQVGEATVDKDKNVVVESKVFMMAGQVYNVSWKLNWSGSGYKIADAKFLGFSMVNQERSIFADYISKKSGDVMALITALDRQ
jgi:phospholipid transport system substrate-binding protein